MNRTTQVVLLVLSCWAVPSRAQEPATPPVPAPQADAIDGIVRLMRAAEAGLTSARLELETTGRLQGDTTITARGVLHVLRGAQPALHTKVDFAFGDGIAGRMEAVQTAAGITLFEDNPVFGELHLHIGPRLVADLEWAGEVLQKSSLPGKSGLPGMTDRRATSPLGTSMLVELARHFALVEDQERTVRDGDRGQWLVGKRRAGLDAADAELPLADRVELFVRSSDWALLEVKHWQVDKLLQHLVVKRLDLGLNIPPATFVTAALGQPLREVENYPPMRDLIESQVALAEEKCAETAVAGQPAIVRPSKRK